MESALHVVRNWMKSVASFSLVVKFSLTGAMESASHDVEWNLLQTFL